MFCDMNVSVTGAGAEADRAVAVGAPAADGIADGVATASDAATAPAASVDTSRRRGRGAMTTALSGGGMRATERSVSNDGGSIDARRGRAAVDSQQAEGRPEAGWPGMIAKSVEPGSTPSPLQWRRGGWRAAPHARGGRRAADRRWLGFRVQV